MMRTLRRIAGLSWRERFLLLEISSTLLLARIVIACLPFRRVEGMLGRRSEDRAGDAGGLDEGRLRRMGELIRGAAGRLPWKNACLVQVLAGKWVLARRGTPTRVYIGVWKADAQFAAHAWLKSGDVVLTGESEMDKYDVLTVYAAP